MSDSEDENYCFYGKALDPYDEDAFPKKRPISVEDQVAKDAQGRRRFHGAFTGGFSAGFYNTVGSLEGWRPSEFKSSRGEKAEAKARKPEDYMDDEDISEYGIAPKTVKATDDYSTTKKRRRQVFSDGPIPGDPVLHTLISNTNETIGYLLMKNMHLKKKSEEQDKKTDDEKIYGCVMPKTYEIQRTVDYEETIPKIYLTYLKNPKSNTFGLGYAGLDKSTLNTSKSTQLIIKDVNNKKLSISGQAFGVGAFEHDDDDIYVKDDMSQYDFELKSEAKAKKPVAKSDSVFDIFTLSKTPLLQTESFPPPIIPQSFSGFHKVKRSRFEPMQEEVVARREINASLRAKYLGEDVGEVTASKELKRREDKSPSKPSTSRVEVKEEPKDENSKKTDFSTDLLFGKFVAATIEENIGDILQKVERTETLHGSFEMREAVKLKMYGPLTRIVVDWQPCSLLCKRFNIPEPTTADNLKKESKRKNHIIFEYQKNNDAEATLQPGLKTTTVTEPIQETSSTPEVPTPTPNQIQESVEEKIPETAIETPDITDRIDVSKNIDLFKAVFLDSSESESDDEESKEQESKTKNELIKATVMSDLIPKIKPTKEGILSNIGQIRFNPLFKSKPAESSERKSDGSNEDEAKMPDDPNLYGPKLPDLIQTVQNEFAVPKPKPKADDVWVEKDAVERGKSHKHKKHKKEKRHKKEHKSKRRK